MNFSKTAQAQSRSTSRSDLHTLITVSLLVGMMMALSGCAGLLLGAGATAGVAAFDERGIKVVAQDTATSTKIRAKLLDREDQLFTDVGVEVHDSRVLMTGRVATEDMRADAINIAWSVENVNDVINEINVSPNPLSDIANDSWITTKLRSKMTFDGDILAINFAVETVGGVIYLIGIAQDAEEVDRVIRHARDIKYVKRVVNHIRIKKPDPEEPPKEKKAS